MKTSIYSAASIAAIFAVLLLSGCGKETVDGSSAAKLDSSLKIISQNTEIEKKEDLDNAIKVIRTRYRNQADLSKAIDGMSADEIIEKGKDTAKELQSIKNKQLQEYKEKIVGGYKNRISSVQNQLEEEQKKSGNLADFYKERYENRIRLETEAMENFENMSSDEFESYAKNKGWQPDYSKI